MTNAEHSMGVTRRQADAPGDRAWRPPHLLLVLVGRVGGAMRNSHGDYDVLYGRGLRQAGPVRLSVLPLVDEPAAALPSAEAYDGIVLSGGLAMVTDRPAWLEPATRLVRQAVDKQVPLLGVCLGHQVLGHAMGARVGPHERGWAIGTERVTLAGAAREDALLAHLPERFAASVSHMQAVLEPSPALQVLGVNGYDRCHVIRAGVCAWGVQFHPEFDRAFMDETLTLRAKDLDARLGAGGAARRRAALEATPEAASVLGAFARICAGGAA